MLLRFSIEKLEESKNFSKAYELFLYLCCVLTVFFYWFLSAILRFSWPVKRICDFLGLLLWTVRRIWFLILTLLIGEEIWTYSDRGLNVKKSSSAQGIASSYWRSWSWLLPSTESICEPIFLISIFGTTDLEWLFGVGISSNWFVIWSGSCAKKSCTDVFRSNCPVC